MKVLMPTGLFRAIACAVLMQLGMLAHAQEDAADEPQPETPVEETVADDTEVDEELEAELDTQGFDPTADDDFVPSEDIPADAPIDFPTDI